MCSSYFINCLKFTEGGYKYRQLVSISLMMFCLLLSGSKSYAAGNEDLTTFGDYAQIALPVTAGVIAIIKGDFEGMFQVMEGALYTSALTHGLKYAINSERPNGSDYSFPSGHTSAATQGAAFLQFRYGIAYGLPAYAIAAVVGYSRVQSEYHWWIDVIGGALLATGVQYIITKKGWSLTNVFFTPTIEDEKVGFLVDIKF